MPFEAPNLAFAHLLFEQPFQKLTRRPAFMIGLVAQFGGESLDRRQPQFREHQAKPAIGMKLSAAHDATSSSRSYAVSGGNVTTTLGMLVGHAQSLGVSAARSGNLLPAGSCSSSSASAASWPSAASASRPTIVLQACRSGRWAVRLFHVWRQ